MKSERRTGLKYEDLMLRLVTFLRERKPVFHSVRVQGEVRLDMDGTTKGYVRVDPASANVGLAFKVRTGYGGLAMPVVFAKANQHQRKKVAVACALLMSLFDFRPSEEKRKSRTTSFSDPKTWYEAFDDGNDGEITHAYETVRAISAICPTLIDFFSLLEEARKSAVGEDLKEAIDRVKKELPFLVGRVSAEDWIGFYNQVLVDEVHHT